MPIRIRKDRNTNNSSSGNNNFPGRGSGSNGSGIIGSLLTIVLNYIFKKPKLLIPILVIGVIIYFFAGDGCQSTMVNQIASQFSRGTEFDQGKYDNNQIFEPLADISQNNLPSKASLEKYCPTRLNQGQQGSCVGWSSAYAARTILEARATGQNPDKVTFSPSSLYNRISLSGCNGAYITDAMKVLKNEGVLPFKDFKYNDQSCSKKHTSSELSHAKDFVTKGYNRLTLEYSGGKRPDIPSIKQNIAQGAPVVIGMMVGGTFMTSMQNKGTWIPSQSDYNMRDFGGHAMCIVGYDDQHQGGSFRIMNSWGENWGDNGFCWVRYKDFDYFTKEAYGLYPMGNAETVDNSKMNVQFGIIKHLTSENIPFKYQGGITYRTTSPLKKGENGDEFKIEVTNSSECYTYVFAQETNGQTYILFPYTERHSAYCGVVGTRLFPREEHMYPDSEGELDKMCIVTSKVEIDFKELNNQMNKINSSKLETKVTTALGDLLIDDAQFGNNKNISINTNIKGDKKAVAVVLEIDKI